MARPKRVVQDMKILNTPFRLMDLPPELRNNIYNLYFEDIKVVDKTKRRQLFPRILNEKNEILTSIPRTAFSISALRPYLNLLHASAQIRSEAASIFYKGHIGSPGLPLVVRCDFSTTEIYRRKVLSRAQDFCSSVAIYNGNAKLLIWFDIVLGEGLSIRMLQTILNEMLQQAQVASSDPPFSRQISFNWGAMDRGDYPDALNKMLQTFPEIEQFEVGHVLKSWSDQQTLASLFIQGPLAKLDLHELELRFKVYPRSMEISLVGRNYIARTKDWFMRERPSYCTQEIELDTGVGCITTN